MEFLKSEDLELNSAKYLVSKKTGKPVKHSMFVKEQEGAEYLTKLVDAMEGKNFKQTKVDNLNDIKAQVVKSMSESSVREYVKNGKAPVSKTIEDLTDFAMKFSAYHDDVDKNSSINAIMNEYNKIDDVEKVGDYFAEGIVKLNKIYSTKEILAAAQAYITKIA